MITIEFVYATIIFVLFCCLAIIGFCETVEEIKKEIKGKK